MDFSDWVYGEKLKASGGVVLSESGDTSLTCGVPLLEGGYDEGRPMGIGVWLQLDELKGNWEENRHLIITDRYYTLVK